MQVFAIKKEQLSKNKRGLLFEMDLVGGEYFHDRTQLVQESFDHVTGTEMIKKIHDKYLGSSLSVLVESVGLWFAKNFGTINSLKPFKAIDDARAKITFAQYPGGSNVYYHDKDGVKLAPAEYLMNTLNAQETFEQRATWGANFENMMKTNIIIDYSTDRVINGGTPQKSSRASVENVLDSSKQAFKVIDAASNKLIYNQAARLITPGNIVGTPFIGLAAGLVTGQINESVLGGRHSFVKQDTNKIAKENVRRVDLEHNFAAAMADAPVIYVKVPIQGGLKCTVGRGVMLRFLPPIGDRQEDVDPDVSMLTGMALCADIVHEVHNDNTLSSTTLRCVKGGFNS